MIATPEVFMRDSVVIYTRKSLGTERKINFSMKLLDSKALYRIGTLKNYANGIYNTPRISATLEEET